MGICLEGIEVNPDDVEWLDIAPFDSQWWGSGPGDWIHPRYWMLPLANVIGCEGDRPQELDFNGYDTVAHRDVEFSLDTYPPTGISEPLQAFNLCYSDPSDEPCEPVENLIFSSGIYIRGEGAPNPAFVVYLGVIPFAPDIPDPPFPGEEYSSRRLLTVKKEAVSGNPLNTHVMFEFAGTQLDDNLLYSFMMYKKGALLKLITPEEVEIPCEMGVKMDDAGQISVRLFFLAPELSSETDTYFYLYYGNRNDNLPTFEPRDVWSESRSGVWHYGYEVMGAYADTRG